MDAFFSRDIGATQQLMQSFPDVPWRILRQETRILKQPPKQILNKNPKTQQQQTSPPLSAQGGAYLCIYLV